MRKKYERFVFALIVFFVFAGCHKKENAATEKNIENGLVQTGDAVGHNITDFFYDEILNGNRDVSFRNGENGVIDFFGEPDEENKTPVSFHFEGATVVEIQELVYGDIRHRYYKSESGLKLYSGFLITKKSDRLKTINIGDTSEKLRSQFTDTYHDWAEYEDIEENISYYTDPVVCEIQFVIKGSIIQEIWCNFLLI
jgi:hypothetical protein